MAVFHARAWRAALGGPAELQKTCSHRHRGGALLAVMWLSLALAAIAFSLASTVRGETERTSSAIDGLRSYYLATGAIERAILYMQWGAEYYTPGAPLFRFPFPTGETEVEIIPEAAKLNINTAPPEALLRLMEAVGVPGALAFQVVEAIVDWRTAKPVSPLDRFYMAQTPSFQAPHASFEQIEELLLVRGMTPELFYGTYERDAAGRLVPRGGLRDCLSVYGAADRFDANFVHPAMLASLGMPPDMIRAIVERRRIAPFRNIAELNAFTQGATSGMERLRVGGNSIYTLRATARLRLQNGQLSDQRRTVAAMVKFMPPGYDATYHILRWYDTAWRN